jgi:RAP1 GTPase activating protein 1
VKEGQYTEEQILDNNENSPEFTGKKFTDVTLFSFINYINFHYSTEFLQLLGDKVRLRGFDKYKGGLDTVHDLTG